MSPYHHEKSDLDKFEEFRKVKKILKPIKYELGCIVNINHSSSCFIKFYCEKYKIHSTQYTENSTLYRLNFYDILVIDRRNVIVDYNNPKKRFVEFYEVSITLIDSIECVKCSEDQVYCYRQLKKILTI